MALTQRILSLLRGRTVYYLMDENDPKVVELDLAAIYRTQSNLQSVITFVADNIAQLPLKVYSLAEDGSHERVRESAAARLFMRPNEFMTCYELQRSYMSDMCLFGRVLWVVTQDDSAPSGWEILPIRPKWIVRYHGQSPFYPEFVDICTRSGGDIVRIPATSFVLFHNYDPADPARALSPVTSLRATLTEQVEADRYRKAVWKRGGRMSSYITRPRDVKPWTADQRTKFQESFKDAWTSDLGSSSGGTIILEDGMEIHSMQFNAREAQWAEAKKFSREDVAGVFHVNPGLIWPGEGQSYASAKDNARALYNDTLGPMIAQFEQRVSQFLLPMLGEEGHYVELDFSKKLRGSFEEQAQLIQTLTGGPVLSRNEGRSRLNYPHVDGYDEIITPLNVIEGAQASPTDTSPNKPQNNPTSLMEASADPSEKALSSGGRPRKTRGTPADGAADELAERFRHFYERQGKAVLPKIGALKASGVELSKDGGNPEWWDAKRWNRELAEDLDALAHAQSTEAAKRALRELSIDLDYDEQRTKAYVRSMCEHRAEAINRVTLRRLQEALELTEEDEGQTPQRVFADAAERKSRDNGQSLAAAVAGWAVLEAIRQAKRDPRYESLEPTKTWIHNPSQNPRAEHARMNGETVAYDQPFSNGADWPGDTGALDANEIVNCKCEVEITIP